MLTEILKDLSDRDLKKLKTEIESYKEETAMWTASGEIPNSGGKLARHLVGNLKHFIGAVLGNSGYVRDRDLEFSIRGTSRADILRMIDETMADVAAGLDKLTPEKLEQEYPIVVFADRTEPMTTLWFLIHLATHLNYHLGQINYHRRLFDAESSEL